MLDDAERVPDERQFEEREAPDAVALDRPRAEQRLAARVVPEAALRENRIEDGEVPFETRRPAADDLARAEPERRPVEEQ